MGLAGRPVSYYRTRREETMSSESARSRFSFDFVESGRLFYPWLAVIAIGLLVGLYGAFRLLTEGTVTLGISTQVPWGILISTYVFFVLVSTGICIGVTSIATVFGVEKYRPLVKRGVLLSLITLIAGGLVIIVSLGRPERSIIQMVLSPNPASPMWWMIGLYGLYGVALVAEFYLLEWGRSVSRKAAMAVGALALIAAIAAHSTLGAVFGFAEARPYYGGFFGPVYFILSAILSGIAVMAFVTVTEYKAAGRALGQDLEELVTSYLGKSLALVLGVAIFFVTWKILTGLTATSEATAAAYEYMLFGPPAWWYWTIGILLGMVIPFLLVLYPGTRTVTGVLAASAMVIVGLFVTRFEYVLGGQIIALIDDPTYGEVLSYSPTFVELAVVVLGFAVAALLYTIGHWLFDLEGVPAHHGGSATSARATHTTGGDSDD